MRCYCWRLAGRAAPPCSHVASPCFTTHGPESPPLSQVRAWLGVQHRPEAAGLDGFNLAAAAAFLCYALFVGLTGKKV